MRLLNIDLCFLYYSWISKVKFNVFCRKILCELSIQCQSDSNWYEIIWMIDFIWSWYESKIDRLILNYELYYRWKKCRFNRITRWRCVPTPWSASVFSSISKWEQVSVTERKSTFLRARKIREVASIKSFVWERRLDKSQSKTSAVLSDIVTKSALSNMTHTKNHLPESPIVRITLIRQGDWLSCRNSLSLLISRSSRDYWCSSIQDISATVRFLTCEIAVRFDISQSTGSCRT